MLPTSPLAGDPVTVVVRRRVRPGRDADYEAWLQELQSEARRLPGYLGVSTQRPAPAGPREYVSVIRFASLEHLQAFESSELRARFLERVSPLVESDAVWERLTGFEVWFSAPAGASVAQPSRPRMAALMTVVVFGLVLVIGSVVRSLLAWLPFGVPDAVALLVTIALEVAFMTWWLMPWLTRRLAWWIYPSRPTA